MRKLLSAVPLLFVPFAAAADPAGHITGGSSIKATRTYNVEHARALIAHGFDEEFATKDDDE